MASSSSSMSRSNQCLSDVGPEVSENPLGVRGLRSLLRLLSHETSSLRRFHCQGCFLAGMPCEMPS